MRADRLVAVLLLLQQRGQVTAAEVAEELEVSERTARRDLDALGMAGVPVYAVRGRGGGWRLAGGGTIDLSGLTAEEARALFLVAGPQPTASREVRAALRKLLRALPEPLRAQAEAASSRVVIDRSGWDRPPDTVPPAAHLGTVQGAVIDGEQVRLGYVARDGTPTTRTVHPLGLAAKGPTWYLFAQTDGGTRAFRVDRMTSVAPTGEPVVRPEGFDLAGTWRRFIDEVDRMRTPLVAEATVDPDLVRHLRTVLGTRLAIGGPEPDGRIRVELRGHTVRSLVAEVGGFGAALEVHGPPEVRVALARLGRELTGAYGP